MKTTKKQLEAAKVQLEAAGISTSNIELDREGLVLNGESKEAYSFFVKLNDIEKDVLEKVYEVAHRNLIHAQLNRLHDPENGSSEIIIDLV